MFELAVGRYRVQLYDGDAPTMLGEYRSRAGLCEELGIWSKSGAMTASEDGRLFCVTVSQGSGWPFLVVAQRYTPRDFDPGIALVEETSRLFVGAGDRLLCYDLETPARLWEDSVMVGFWFFCRHGDVLLMSAELELAAFDLRGEKLWNTNVEPPWHYEVRGDNVHLDVMGKTSVFALKCDEA
jgi:hypothetical protein